MMWAHDEIVRHIPKLSLFDWWLVKCKPMLYSAWVKSETITSCHSYPRVMPHVGKLHVSKAWPDTIQLNHSHIRYDTINLREELMQYNGGRAKCGTVSGTQWDSGCNMMMAEQMKMSANRNCETLFHFTNEGTANKYDQWKITGIQLSSQNNWTEKVTYLSLTGKCPKQCLYRKEIDHIHCTGYCDLWILWGRWRLLMNKNGLSFFAWNKTMRANRKMACNKQKKIMLWIIDAIKGHHTKYNCILVTLAKDQLFFDSYIMYKFHLLWNPI